MYYISFLKIVIAITIMKITIFLKKMRKKDCRPRKNVDFCGIVKDSTVMIITIFCKAEKQDRHEILRQGKRTKATP